MGQALIKTDTIKVPNCNRVIKLYFYCSLTPIPNVPFKQKYRDSKYWKTATADLRHYELKMPSKSKFLLTMQKKAYKDTWISKFHYKTEPQRISIEEIYGTLIWLIEKKIVPKRYMPIIRKLYDLKKDLWGFFSIEIQVCLIAMIKAILKEKNDWLNEEHKMRLQLSAMFLERLNKEASEEGKDFYEYVEGMYQNVMIKYWKDKEPTKETKDAWANQEEVLFKIRK
jgi:hypothetical protein